MIHNLVTSIMKVQNIQTRTIKKIKKKDIDIGKAGFLYCILDKLKAKFERSIIIDITPGRLKGKIAVATSP